MKIHFPLHNPNDLGTVLVLRHCSDLARGLPKAAWEDWGMLGKSWERKRRGELWAEPITPRDATKKQNQVFATATNQLKGDCGSIQPVKILKTQDSYLHWTLKVFPTNHLFLLSNINRNSIVEKGLVQSLEQ